MATKTVNGHEIRPFADLRIYIVGERHPGGKSVLLFQDDQEA